VDPAAAQGGIGVNWDADQLRWLRALGHEPMLLASSMPAAAHAAEAAPAPSAPPSQPGRRDALLAALARAAGGRDLAALGLDLEQLRREPRAKRALWPKLRALRREH